MLKLILFLSLSVWVVTGLRCYSCDPKETGECTDPVNDNAQITACEPDEKRSFSKIPIAERRNFAKNFTFDCITVYYKAEQNSTLKEGTYRGCLQRPVELTDNTDICQYVSANFFPNGALSTCTPCKDDHCNKNDGNNGTLSVTISLITMIISTIICVTFGNNF